MFTKVQINYKLKITYKAANEINIFFHHSWSVDGILRPKDRMMQTNANPISPTPHPCSLVLQLHFTLNKLIENNYFLVHTDFLELYECIVLTSEQENSITLEILQHLTKFCNIHSHNTRTLYLHYNKSYTINIIV